MSDCACRARVVGNEGKPRVTLPLYTGHICVCEGGKAQGVVVLDKGPCKEEIPDFFPVSRTSKIQLGRNLPALVVSAGVWAVINTNVVIRQGRQRLCL